MAVVGRGDGPVTVVSRAAGTESARHDTNRERERQVGVLVVDTCCAARLCSDRQSATAILDRANAQHVRSFSHLRVL